MAISRAQLLNGTFTRTKRSVWFVYKKYGEEHKEIF
jgi:hypothetical protein